MRRYLRPEEALFLVCGMALVGLSAYAHMLYFTPTHHWPFVAITGLVAAVRGVRERTFAAAAQGARDFLPFIGIILLYETLHDLTPILRPTTVDGALAAADRALFGRDLAVWMISFATPWLTRAMVFCYASYFFATWILGGAIYLFGTRPHFRQLMLAVSISSVIGYMTYLAVPAVGPYIYQAAQFPQRLPGATPGTHWVVSTIDALKGAARDCFPSMHTAHTTLVLLGARAFRRWLFWLYLPIAVGLYVSTIYLRMHYAVDVFAGLALAGACWWLAPKVDDRWRLESPAPT